MKISNLSILLFFIHFLHHENTLCSIEKNNIQLEIPESGSSEIYNADDASSTTGSFKTIALNSVKSENSIHSSVDDEYTRRSYLQTQPINSNKKRRGDLTCCQYLSQCLTLMRTCIDCDSDYEEFNSQHD